MTEKPCKSHVTIDTNYECSFSQLKIKIKISSLMTLPHNFNSIYLEVNDFTYLNKNLG